MRVLLLVFAFGTLALSPVVTHACTYDYECAPYRCVGATEDTEGSCDLSSSTNYDTGGDSIDTGGSTGGGVLINPLQGGGDLWGLLNGILRFVINIGAIVVVLMMVYVGFKFVTARGNETAVTEAKKMLLWTVVGALILLGAQAISLGIRATVEALAVGG